MTKTELKIIALVCFCETLLNAIRNASDHPKRKYWVERGMTALRGIDATIIGSIPDEFIEKADAFYRKIELEYLA